MPNPGRILAYSGKFFRRNPFLCVIYISIISFFSINVLGYGWGSVCDMIVCLGALSFFFTLLRLPAANREWLDLDDCMTVIFHDFFFSLEVYFRGYHPQDQEGTKRYKMSRSRKLKVSLYRIVWCVASGFVVKKISDIHIIKEEYSPYLAIAAFIVAIAAGMCFGAYAAWKSEKYFTDGIDNEII